MYQLLEIRKGLKSYLIADTFSKIKNLLFRRFFCLEIFYFPQLPINKSLSEMRGFYWYLTIIEGEYSPHSIWQSVIILENYCRIYS